MRYDDLRQDLLEFFGTEVAKGSLKAVMDLSMVEMASSDEIVKIAKKNGFDLSKYMDKDIDEGEER